MAKDSIGDTVTTLAVGEETTVRPSETVTSLSVGEEDPPPTEPKPKPASKTATIPGDNPLGAW